MKAVPLSKIASETGFSTRYWRARAAAGDVPGAYQPSGRGGEWRVDAAEFKAWWEGVRAKEWRVSTSAAKKGKKPIGAASRVTAWNADDLLEQRLRKLRASG